MKNGQRMTKREVMKVFNKQATVAKTDFPKEGIRKNDRFVYIYDHGTVTNEMYNAVRALKRDVDAISSCRKMGEHELSALFKNATFKYYGMEHPMCMYPKSR